MISLFYNPPNPYGRYGMDHFIRRSGIPFETELSVQGGVLSYGRGVEDLFSIKIQKNSIQNRICGRVSCGNTPVAVCEMPENTGHGEKELAFFTSGETNYPCVTRHAGGIDVGVDIFQETGYLLSGHLDRIRAEMDGPDREMSASHPSVDILEDLLMAAVFDGCRTLHVPLVRKSPWPDAKKFAVCLTHDVDEVKKTYQWLTRPARCLRQGDFSGLKNQFLSMLGKIRGVEPYWTFDDIAATEKHFNAKSTFFFLKESGKPSFLSPRTWNLYGRCHSYREPGVIDAIQVVSGYGSEVAVHGSFYSYSSLALIKNETDELEAMIGEKVVGTRQHHLNLSVPATWDYQAAAGLSYDSSLGFKDRSGFRWGTSYPFFPFTGTVPQGICEIPLIIMDISILSHAEPLAECLGMADEVEPVGGVLTLLWHPPVFNAFEFPGAGEIYYKIIEHSVQRNAWITCAKDIISWLRRREALDVSFRKEGTTFLITMSDFEGDGYLSVYSSGHAGPELSENATLLRKESSSAGDMECFYIRAGPAGKNNGIVVSIR